MSKSSGGNRKSSSSKPSATSLSSIKRTGPGFSEPIKGPVKPSSKATEIQYVFVDKITGNESNGYASETAVKNAIKRADKNDKQAGIYAPDNYYIQRIEVIKNTNRSARYWNG